MSLIQCKLCKKLFDRSSEFCPKCNALSPIFASDSSYKITLILCLLFGFLGFHRMFIGKWGSGVFILISFFILMIFLILTEGWSLVPLFAYAFYDFCSIFLGKMKDANGRIITY